MHPHEMRTEEQDLRFGKPQFGPIVIEILESRSNLHHDRITFDALTADDSRILLTFSQAALRTLAQLGRDHIEGADRPKAS